MTVQQAEFVAATGYADVVTSPVTGESAVVVRAGEPAVALPDNHLRQIYRVHTQPGVAGALAPPQAVDARRGRVLEALKDDLLNAPPMAYGPEMVPVLPPVLALQAHAKLMALKPAEFDAVLKSMDGHMLSAYVMGLVAEDRWDLHDTRPNKLVEFAIKVALDTTAPANVNDSFVFKLRGMARLQLLRGVFGLPNRALHERLRQSLGPAALEHLLAGKAKGTTIGKNYLAGHLPARNVTDEFKALYNTGFLKGDPAEARPIRLPPNRSQFDYVMLRGLYGNHLPGYMEVNRRALAMVQKASLTQTVEALEDAGIKEDQLRLATYNTASSTYDAAVAIARQLLERYRETGRRPILLTHSMGARHTHALLSESMQAFQKASVGDADFQTVLQVRELLAGNLFIQPALTAQIARDLRDAKPLDPITDGLFFLTGGDRRAFDHMADPIDVPFAGAKVPTVVLATDSSGSALSTMAGVTKLYYLDHHETLSDGAVPTPEQVAIDDALLVYLPDAGDHMRPSLTATDAAEYVAKQLDEGAPDDVVRDLVKRLTTLFPKLAGVLGAFETELRSPAKRRQVAADLRARAPVVDRLLRAAQLRSGIENLSPIRGTQACLHILLSEIARRAANR